MLSNIRHTIVEGHSDLPSELANICAHGGYRSNPGEYWVRFNGHDGFIFELFPQEIKEIIERFRFTGTPLQRLLAVYRWANRSWEYQLNWLVEPDLHV